MARIDRKLAGSIGGLIALTFVTLFCIPVSSARSRAERDYRMRFAQGVTVLSHNSGLQGPLGKYASGSLRTEFKISEAAYQAWLPTSGFLPALPTRVGQKMWSYKSLVGMDYSVSWATRLSDGSIILTVDSGLY